MRNRILGLAFFFLLGLSISPIVTAAEPADKIIANAQADLERYESQASALTPGRAANARRILKLMNLSYERLGSSGNQDDSSWIEVNDRYLSLQKQLENLINPAASPATASSTAASTARSGSSQAIQASPASTDSSAVPPSASKTSPSQQSVPALVSGQRVQVKKLARDLANSRNSIVTTGPSQFQDPSVIAARQKRLQQFTDAIARYPQLDDPDVQAARAGYLALRGALSDEFERAKGQLAQIGDVQSSLRQLDENSRAYPIPQPLITPFSAKDASAWVEAAGGSRTVAEHNARQLEIIAPLAYLPNNPGTPEGGSPYDANDVIRLKNNALASLEKIQANYEAMANGLINYMQSMNNDVFQRWQEDPAKNDTRYLFIAEGRPEEAEQVFNQNRAVVNSAIYLEQALDRDSSKAEAVLIKLDQAEADFNRKAQLALASSKLPEPKSNNKQMLKIAGQILSEPSYEFGQHGKIILTTPEIVERERKDSEIDIDDADLSLSGDLTFSGTQTTWTYAWKEFKFATPLKETDSDTWYIWWITAKNFSSGGSRTPLNQWVSGEATKGNPILPENM